MITRRDFIKGLGAMAAAVVMPRVEKKEQPQTLFGKPIVWTDEVLAEGAIVLGPFVGRRVFFVDDSDARRVKHVFCDGEDVTGQCDAFESYAKPDMVAYDGWVRLLELTEDGQAMFVPESRTLRFGAVYWQEFHGDL